MTYIVKSGDTLDKIATRYGSTASELMVANPSIVNANEIFLGQSIELPEQPKPMGPYPSDESLDDNNSSNGLVYCPNVSVPFSPQIAPPIIVDNPEDLAEPCPGSDTKCTKLKVSAYDEEGRVVGDKRVLEVVPATTSGEKITLRQLNFDCSEDIHWSVSSALSKEELDGDGASFNVTPPLLRHASISPLSRWALKAVPKEYRIRSSKDCGVSGQSMTIKTYPSEICKVSFQPEKLHFYQVVESSFQSFLETFVGDNIKVSLLKGTISIEGQWKEHTDYQAFYAYDIFAGFDPLIEAQLRLSIVDALKAFSFPPTATKVIKKYVGNLMFVYLTGNISTGIHLQRSAPEDYSKWEADVTGGIKVGIGVEIKLQIVNVDVGGEGGLSLKTTLGPKGTDPNDKPIKVDFLFTGIHAHVKFQVAGADWLGFEEKYKIMKEKVLISNHALDLFS